LTGLQEIRESPSPPALLNNFSEPTQTGVWGVSVEVNIALGSNAKTKHLFLLQSEEDNAEISVLIQNPRKQSC